MALCAMHPPVEQPVSDVEPRAIPDDGRRYELIGGEVFVSPAPQMNHQDVAGRIARPIEEHAFGRELGVVCQAPTDERLSPSSVVQPDVLFIRRDHAQRIMANLVDGPPETVVEVRSESTQQTDLIRKPTLDADHGVPEYWVVDPEAETLIINVRGQGRCLPHPRGEGAGPSDVLAGLTVESRDLFHVPDWLQREQ